MPAAEAGPFTIYVRIWREPDAHGDGEWRGNARNLLTGESCYFRRFEGLARAIERITIGGAPDDRPGA